MLVMPAVVVKMNKDLFYKQFNISYQLVEKNKEKGIQL